MEFKISLLYQRLQLVVQYLATAAALLLFYGTPTASAQTAAQIAKTKASTVSIEMKDNTGKIISIGSGFFVQPNLIATNYHIIVGTASGTAKVDEKDTHYNIEGFTAIDKTNDLALLKVTAHGVKPLPLGNSDTLQIGETVHVADNSLGYVIFWDGIIKDLSDKYTTERILMTARLAPGRSGAPVLNRWGEVIGMSYIMTESIMTESGEHLQSAIPSRYLKALLAESKRARPFSWDTHSISAETYFLRGKMMESLRRHAEAIEAYTQAIRRNPNYNAYYNRGLAKSWLGQYVAAIQDYNKAIQLKPDDSFIYSSRGSAKNSLGQYFEAIQDYDKAIQLNPDFANAYYSRARVKEQLNQYAAAIQDYDKAIQLKPDDSGLYLNRGDAKTQLGQHFAAIQDYDKVIQIFPKGARAYHSRGNIKAKLGQYFDAIQDYDKAIQVNSNYTIAYHSRGYIKAKLGQYFDAIQDYDKAIQLSPDDFFVYFNRGIAKAKLGQHAAAIQDYDKAIQLNPDFANAYHSRGLSKALLNRTWEAKQDFHTALRLAEKAADTILKARIEESLRFLEARN